MRLLLLPSQHSTGTAACMKPETGGLYCACWQLWTARSAFSELEKLDQIRFITKQQLPSRPEYHRNYSHRPMGL